MNSNTYAEMAFDEREVLRRQGGIGIDESIPDGLVRRGGELMTPNEAVMQAKREAEQAAIGHKYRSGYTKPGPQKRDKTKAKAARAARKRNRK